MTTKNIYFLIGLILFLFVVGFVFIKFQKPAYNFPIPSPLVQLSPKPTPAQATTSAQINEVIITISDSGFSPQTVTIKPNQTITWFNQDSLNHQVNSNPHPTHTDYLPLNNVGFLGPGQKRSLEFPIKGTFKFHDHLNPQFVGSVVVE